MTDEIYGPPETLEEMWAAQDRNARELETIKLAEREARKALESIGKTVSIGPLEMDQILNALWKVLAGESKESQRDIAARLGISQSTVSRINSVLLRLAS